MRDLKNKLTPGKNTKNIKNRRGKSFGYQVLGFGAGGGSAVYTANFLVVAGGGGAGGGGAGGGGGGGYRASGYGPSPLQATALELAAGDYTITLTATNSIGSAQSSNMVTVNLDDANFSYTTTEYCQGDTNPDPTITGLNGGAFSSTPEGLILSEATGVVDLVTSIAGTYTVTYTTVLNILSFRQQF